MWNDVESSNIAAIKHDSETLVLSVKFKNGTIYDYAGVSFQIFDKILKAASVGRTFNELIKANPSAYPYLLVA